MEMKDTQTIFLKDLVFITLRRWRVVLMIALVLALTVGVLTGTGKPVEVDMETYQTELEAFQSEVEEVALKVQQSQLALDSHQDYMDNAVIQNLNPYSFYEACFRGFVDTGYQIQPEMSYQSPDRTGSVLQTYQLTLTGGDNLDALAKSMNIEAEYLKDAVLVETDAKAGILSVRILCATEKEAEKALDYSILMIESAIPVVEKQVASHTMTCLQADVKPGNCEDVLEAQKTAEERQKSLEEQAEERESDLNEKLEERPAMPAGGSSWKEGVKFGILAGIVGAMLAVIWIWLCHIFSTKVYSVRVLYARTGVKILGCAAEKTGKCVIDRWLRRLEGRKPELLTEMADVFAQDLENRLTGDSLMIAGGNASARGILTDALKQAMPSCNITDGEDLQQAENLKALRKTSALVLLAKCGETCYAEVARQATLANDYEIPLLGCILIDG